jgi:NADH-quinone oxidoreductase subunit N
MFLGLIILASSKNLLMTYAGVELTSLALYIKSVFKVNDNQTSEAGLKYFILGSFSSGLFLFGCSLIYGFTGTIDFYDLRLLFIDKNVPMEVFGGVLLGSIFITIGLLFKLGASPFHM